jgi:dienelactone hydrolase
MNPGVLGAVCFYATDIHKGGLGLGMKDDSIARAGEIKGELLMVWGRQDPHIPTEGRMKVLARLNEVGTRLNWHEVNGAHAFLRDEGVRYDPELARTPCWAWRWISSTARWRSGRGGSRRARSSPTTKSQRQRQVVCLFTDKWI